MRTTWRQLKPGSITRREASGSLTEPGIAGFFLCRRSVGYLRQSASAMAKSAMTSFFWHFREELITAARVARQGESPLIGNAFERFLSRYKTTAAGGKPLFYRRVSLLNSAHLA
ncbi:Uncharacterised protein [Cedecea neteri]|uniref:Uncharacterized protein n=1 Tax=Cedecea neteri TaxID=158822 RepID=A0A2X3KT44_9ENTR|nr:Uncharacterised protein [Cedecea neteri]